jgi:hypothetical protein
VRDAAQYVVEGIQTVASSVGGRKRVGYVARAKKRPKLRKVPGRQWAEMWMGRALYGLWWQRAVSWPRDNSLFSLDGERRVRIGKRKTANEEWWSGDRERRGWEEERKVRTWAEKQLLDVLYAVPSQTSTSHRLVLRKGEVNAECR